jgi:hypothetical protein
MVRKVLDYMSNESKLGQNKVASLASSKGEAGVKATGQGNWKVALTGKGLRLLKR